MKFDKNFLESLTQKIKEIEKVSSAEIVIIPYNKSYSYFEISLLAGLIVSLAISTYMMIAPQVFDYWVIFWTIWITIIITFVIFELINPLKRLFIPKKIRKRRSDIIANAIFSKAEICNTIDRTGILIFISKFEKTVIFLPDKGVKQNVPKNKLEEINKEFSEIFKDKKPEKKLFETLDKLKTLLEEYLPIKPDDINELDDSLYLKIRF